MWILFWIVTAKQVLNKLLLNSINNSLNIDQNCIHEEIKSRLNSGNACYHWVQSLLLSRLLSRNVKVKIYKTVILPVVLYGYKTWPLTLREEHRLRVFENRVLKEYLDLRGMRWRENRGSCTMRNIIICTHPQISLGKSRRMRWAGHVARMGEERKVYKVLVGKPEGKRALGRQSRRWEDGIRMDLRDIGWGECRLDPVGSRQGPVAGCCECCDEPSGSCATELFS
jgi:hypothetical protein